MTAIDYDQTTHIIQVRRGNMRINFPFNKRGLRETDPAALAHSSVSGMLRLQLAWAGKREVTEPIDMLGKIPIVLKLPDRDGSMQPDISLERQLEGRWQELDVEKIKDLGEGAIHEMHGRCSFVVLDLVDSLRAV